MPKISLEEDDSAGGPLISKKQSTFKINGKKVIVEGDSVTSHGKSPHDAAKVNEGSSWFTWEGKKVIVEGKPATCGDLTTGSVWNIPS